MRLTAVVLFCRRLVASLCATLESHASGRAGSVMTLLRLTKDKELNMKTTGLSRSRLERMHQVLSGYVQRQEMPGLVALVSHHDDVHVEALGTLAFGDPIPMQRDTIFRIASIWTHGSRRRSQHSSCVNSSARLRELFRLYLHSSPQKRCEIGSTKILDRPFRLLLLSL